MIDYPNILVAFFDEYNEGHTFERWPHHITLLPWFRADNTALTNIEEISKVHLPIGIVLSETAMFGHKGDILVRLVESPGLEKLHKALINQRKGLLGLIDSRHTNEGFRPHVTLQGKNDPKPGSLTIKRITLVKHTGQGKTKRVVKNY